MLRAQLLGYHAGQHVYLVGTGCGYEKVCLLHPRLALHRVADAIALYTYYVQLVCGIAQRIRPVVYYGNVVAFLGKACR